jgi:hypothetical protein
MMEAMAQAGPFYSMACFKLPPGLCQHIDTYIRILVEGEQK